MFQSIRRLTAAVLAGGLMFTLAACGGEPKNPAADQLAMTVNGQEISVGTYAANFLYGKASIENMFYQYGISNMWESDLGASYKEQLNEVARNQSAALLLVPEQFEAAGLTLTDEDLANASEPNPELQSLGFTDELTEQYSRYFLMLDKLGEYYFGENGAMSPGEEEVEAYFQENYVRAKHVLISAMDDSQQAITDATQLAALEQKAQSVYERAAAGEDFDALIEEFGEDPGMASNPDGYQFTDGTMVSEFEDAVKALGMNEISPPVRTDYGWHIIQRLPLLEDKRAEVYGEIVTALTGMDMNSLLDQWVGEAEITTEPILSEINFDNVDDYKYSVS